MKIILLLLICSGAFGQTPSVKVAGNIVTLSFTGTNIGAYQWTVNPSVGTALIYGGSDYANKTVTINPAVKYTFTLLTWAKDGTPVKTASVVYDPTVIVPPVPKKDTCAKFLFIMFTDGTTTTIKQ